MSASAVYDEDLEAIIMAADETPEYKDELIENYITRRTKRKKRRLSNWSSIVLVLFLTVFCSLLIDKVVSFPLSAVALVLIWLGLIGFYAVNRTISLIEQSLLRVVLKKMLSRRGYASFALSIAALGLKRLRRLFRSL